MSLGVYDLYLQTQVDVRSCGPKSGRDITRRICEWGARCTIQTIAGRIAFHTPADCIGSSAHRWQLGYQRTESLCVDIIPSSREMDVVGRE